MTSYVSSRRPLLLTENGTNPLDSKDLPSDLKTAPDLFIQMDPIGSALVRPGQVMAELLPHKF